ncbi:MAG: phenylacetate--CoA ligase family protein [Planctomycetota bacterium]
MNSNSISLEARQRKEKLTLTPEALEQHQLSRFNSLLSAILPKNQFYQRHLGDLKNPISNLDTLGELPFTFKEELIDENQPGNFAVNHTFDLSSYCRFHRTSGTRGKPLVVMDTADDWQWWIDTWQMVLDSANIVPSDRLLMAFSFGPFIGFWSAFDAAVARGALCIPSGGLTTLSRLEMIESTSANVLFCTPSYALHMAEVADSHQIAVADLTIDRIIVAGEPGGSIPEVRHLIQDKWNARVIDHSGASEVGPWGFADEEARGLFINESEFIAEFLSIEHGGPGDEGELCELVLTNLGRIGCPVIRYRTGDIVRPTWNHQQTCRFVLLDGGVLGRTDDMMIIRGVNIFPSSIEQILRSFPEIVEYRLTAFKEGQMDQLKIEIEDRLDQPVRVIEELQIRLGLRVEVQCVPLGTLPRFDLKGKRFIDQR